MLKKFMKMTIRLARNLGLIGLFILVLTRMIFLINAGVESDNFYYLKRSLLIWNTRELFATVQAVLDVYVLQPIPVLGRPELIFAKN